MTKKINKSVSDNNYFKNWIINHLLNKDNNPDTTKSNKKWFNKTDNILMYNNILSVTSFLSKTSYFSERIHCILLDIKKQKTCKSCNNKVKYLDFKRGYRQYCSPTCSNNNTEKIKKTEQTMLDKYGYKNSMQVPSLKEKSKQTCIKKYGVEVSSKNKEVISKMKQTCMNKYGVECSLNYQPIKEKKEKTWKNKYPDGHPLKSQKIKNKIKKTCMKRYGVEHYSQYHIGEYKINNFLNNKKWLIHQHHTLKKSCNIIANELNINGTLISRRLVKFNIEQKRYPTSTFEQEIIEFINLPNIEINTRKIISPYELDIYLPDYKLAIEFNGLYWHSFKEKETKKDKNYHLMKTKACEQKNIQLLHIFENEWVNEIKKDIWKSMINNKLNKNNKIYAEKCIIARIKNNALIKEFLNNNHLQGYHSSSIKLGLFYKNELIGLMTFGKNHLRYCSKKFTNVIRGAHKLYKYLIEHYNPENIIGYVNRSYNNGNLYKELGLTFSHNSKPDYWYFKPGVLKLYNKNIFQKHKLSNLLENFNQNLSASKNMFNHKYRRMWDCGQAIYTGK